MKFFKEISTLYINQIFLFLLIGLCSCGYRFDGVERSEIKSITVPYVKGDIDGQLTTELIRKLTVSGNFECVKSGGEWLLDIKLINQGTERIGYRYLRQHPSDKREKNLIGTENRTHIAAQVFVINSGNSEVILGPFVVQSEIDFDYVDPSSLSDLAFINSNGEKETSIQFSLGQLDSIEGAQDSSLNPVYGKLAQKIVDGIIALTW